MNQLEISISPKTRGACKISLLPSLGVKPSIHSYGLVSKLNLIFLIVFFLVFQNFNLNLKIITNLNS